MTINDAIDIFLVNQRLKGNSPKTISNYTDFLRRFSVYLDNKMLDEVTYIDVNNYSLHLINSGVKVVSVRTYLRHVKVFLHFLYYQQISKLNLATCVMLPKIPKLLYDILSEKEVLTILDQFEVYTLLGARNHAMFMLMLDSGLRKGEVESLKLSNINFEKSYIKVTGKGNKERIVPIGITLKMAMQHYKVHRNFLDLTHDFFFVKSDGAPIGTETLKNIIRDLKKSVKIDRLHCHLLRHTFATNFLLNGFGDIYELSRILGHGELQTTQIYLNIANNLIMMQHKNKTTYIDMIKK